ncbi:obscurin-like protein 1 isoform X2 [Biomphalaria glabrata]|uniref:Obscurin-like protein 1 isoform X2 n=1 Tax=Biomphalaria glabrata TaxID=6526 RepID=A0A9W3BJ98_BIOGL|nr:obscurin-like protein 1 isoform X2 [Biomphalaria glabrata]
MDTHNRWRRWLLVYIYIASLLTVTFSKSLFSKDANGKTQILPGATNYYYKVGDVAELKCPVANLGDRKVVWRLAANDTIFTVGYNIFTEDPRVAVTHHNGTWNLIIKGVQQRDSGLYECQIASVEKYLRSYVALHVADPPERKPKQRTSFVDENNPIELVCNATSEDYPIEDVDWFRDGNALVTDESRGLYIHKKVSLSTDTIYSTLEIKHARLKDQGVYVCRTSNYDVTSIHVNVLNGDSNNVKRGAATKGSSDYHSSRNSQDSRHRSWHLMSLVLASLAWSLSSTYVITRELT